jgi:hypothetical protein
MFDHSTFITTLIYTLFLNDCPEQCVLLRCAFVALLCSVLSLSSRLLALALCCHSVTCECPGVYGSIQSGGLPRSLRRPLAAAFSVLLAEHCP